MTARSEKLRTRLLWVTLMFLAAPHPAFAGGVRSPVREIAVAAHPGSRDSAAVVATVNAFRAALASGDTAAALRLLAPDAIILESGYEESRAVYAAHHLGEDMAFARAVPSQRGPLKVTVVGDVAWVSSSSSSQGIFNGRAVNSAGVELLVLSKKRAGAAGIGSWQIRAIHWSSHRKTQ